MRVLLSAACLVASISVAAASGGLSCSGEDGQVSISIESGMTRGMGSPLFNFAARAEIREETVAADLRIIDFDHTTQYWLDSDTLKLRLYREREGAAPHGYVEAVIETAYDDAEGDFLGEYRLSVYDMTNADDSEAETAEFSGAISCVVE